MRDQTTESERPASKRGGGSGSSCNDLLSAIERLNLSRDRQVPWEHPCYERTDGRSPMMKWQWDCWEVAKAFIDLPSRREFADELRKWWSFDNRQQHTHSWHCREDFIEKKLPALLGR